VAFDSFGSLFGLFLFLGWVASESQQDPHPREAAERPARSNAVKGQAYALESRIACVLLIACACGATLFLNVEMGLASTERLAALNMFADNPDGGTALYRTAFQRSSPYNDDREKLRCASFIVGAAVESRQIPIPQAKVDLVLQLATESFKAHPQDAYRCVYLNALYNELGLNVDKKYFDTAMFFGKRALELSPMRQEAILHLGRTYMLRGEPRGAVELNRKMVEAYELYPAAHWYYGLSLASDHQPEEAKREIRRAIEMGFQLRSDTDTRLVEQLFGPSEFRILMNGK
jgi:tetratricopeptide (TPR) repeat protein